MQIYGWEILAEFHHPGSLLICHVTSHEHMFKGGSPLKRATTLPCLMAIGLVQVEI